ncbi:MAG: hypothetical protein ABSG76_13040 [Xanthobacteraceae bacterium]|jgi:hypothetical protein
MDDRSFTIEFGDVPLADAVEMAGELGRILLDTGPDVSVARRRSDPNTQDPGSILAVVLAAPAVVAVARGIADYIRLRRKARITIKCNGQQVVVSNVSAADAVEIARLITDKC